jgi:hypothetical protein
MGIKRSSPCSLSPPSTILRHPSVINSFSIVNFFIDVKVLLKIREYIGQFRLEIAHAR